MLCLVGGGQDGAALAEAFARAELPAGHQGVVLAGPYMPPAVRASLAAVSDARMTVLDFVPDAGRFVTGAAAVVSMGGYNSVCELLAARRRTLVVPRVQPRTEQLIRARRLERLGLVDVLEPSCVDPARLSRWLVGAVSAEPPPAGRVDLDGLRRVPALAAQLLGSPVPAEVFHVAS